MVKSMRRKGRQVQFTSYMPQEMYEELLKIRKNTKIPTAALFREAMQIVIDKYRSARFGLRRK